MTTERALMNTNPADAANSLAEVVGWCLQDLLARRVLEVALRQRAKFEGWLKVELASALRERGLRPALEVSVPGAGCVADIALDAAEGRRVWLMLKTVNTSFRFPGVEHRSRPLTENVKRVIDDINKLQRAPAEDERLVVYVVFPMSAEPSRREQDWRRYHERVAEAGTVRERAGFVQPRYSREGWGVGWFVLRV